MPTPTAMAQSFSLANMVPQNIQHNGGAWAKIEQDTRKYALRAKGDVYVITGPVFTAASDRIGLGGVRVPRGGFMRLTRWTLTLAVLPISACFSGDIDVVKKFVPEETPRYSLDQLLTPRKSCSKTSWTTLSDDRGRKIVEYACVYAPAKDYLQELTARTREKEQENKAASKRAGEQVLKDKQRELQRLYEQLQEAKELIARAHLPSEALKQLQSDLTVASNIASCSSIPVDQFKHPTIITRAQQTISKCQDRESDVTIAP